MADTTTNKQPLIGGDSENFMRLMNRALTRIERVDSATTKANESLNNYAKSFDELNGKLERYVKLSGNAKSGKFDRITINERVQNVGGGRSRGNSGGGSSSNNSGSNNQYAREAKRVTDNIMDTIFKSINSLGGKQARVVTSTFKKITNTVADVKTLSNGAKAAQNMAKAQKAATSATGASSQAIAGMSTAALGASAVVASVALVLVAMGAAGKYAYERNMDVNRSLMMMGDTANELTSSSSKTANQMIGIKNTWIRIGDDLLSVFEPVFTMIVDFVETISNIVESITSPLDKDSKRQFNSSDSKARWYTSKLEAISGEPENTSLPVIGGIASSAKQSGFDNTSAANLAIGIYDMAMKKARQYGVEASEVAKRLADAWETGSDAAKDYGVVVDDQTLIGYMVSKGVDIVNTQISDAMKQYYRYDLMQTELNANSNDAMQNQIKQWKQLGMQIDATKQKLFSFDEVIQLSAVDTSIPSVGTPGVTYPNSETPGNGVIPPIPGSGPSGNYDVNVNFNITDQAVQALQQQLANMADMFNLNVSVSGISNVDELARAISTVTGATNTSQAALNQLGQALITLGNGTVDSATKSQVLTSAMNNLTGQNMTATQASNLLYQSLASLNMTAQNSGGQITTLADAAGAVKSNLDAAKSSADNFSSSMTKSVSSTQTATSALQSYNSKLQQTIALQQQMNMTSGGESSGRSSGGTNLVSQGNGYYQNKSKSAPYYLSGYGITTKNNNSLSEAFSADWSRLKTMFGFGGSKPYAGKTAGQLWSEVGGYTARNINPFDNKSVANNILTLEFAKGLIGGAAAGGAAAASASSKANVIGTVTTGTGNQLKIIEGGAAKAAKTTGAGLPSNIIQFPKVSGYATGGVGLKETTAKLFEGDKKEAVIPLESQAGIDYLANSMKIALGQDGGSTNGGNSVVVNLTLSGVNIADNDAQWQKVGEKIAEVIEVQKQRRGDLNYGSSF